MKVHKVTFIVVDHDGLGAEGVKAEVENVRYPNYCITPLDTVVETREIGEWRDDHPLNRFSSFAGEVARLFPSLTSDDLIRLVVGMQWREMVLVSRALDAAFESLGKGGTAVTIEVDEFMAAEMKPACNIVDEWLGVR